MTEARTGRGYGPADITATGGIVPLKMHCGDNENACYSDHCGCDCPGCLAVRGGPWRQSPAAARQAADEAMACAIAEGWGERPYSVSDLGRAVEWACLHPEPSNADLAKLIAEVRAGR